MNYFNHQEAANRIKKIYGNCLLVQNEICEVLPAPLPLSFELLKTLVSQKGATGQACRRLHIFYNPKIRIDDYLLLIYGRTFVNKAAEKRLTEGKRGFLGQLKASYTLEAGCKDFYKDFIENKTKEFDDYFAIKNAIDFKQLDDKELLAHLNKIVKELNAHYSLLIEAGFYLKYCLSKIQKKVVTNNELNTLLSINIDKQFIDGWAEKIIYKKHDFLKPLQKYGSSDEYELASPRYLETGDISQVSVKCESTSLRRPGGSLKYYKIYESLQEILKPYLLREFSLIRNTLLEIDKRFVLNGGVFWLTFKELNQGDKFLRDRIEKRKQSRKQLLKVDLPTSLTMQEVDRLGEMRTADKELKGLAVTNQILTGPVRIIRGKDDFKNLRTSDILVCKYASPNLVSIFDKVSGIITETGGLTSHLAVVAREQGFPLVIAAQGATKSIPDGTEISVDIDGNITIKQ